MTRRGQLDIEQIVAAAREVIDTDGFESLSMRRIAGVLGVDPMAIYRHVADRRALLTRVLEDAMGEMADPDASLPWPEYVRSWADAYWNVAVRHRQLIASTLADPAIARGASAATERLIAAIAGSGMDAADAVANAYLVVDFVHGSALGSSERNLDELHAWFQAGLDTILAGMRRR